MAALARERGRRRTIAGTSNKRFVQPDGRTSSSVNIITYVDDNTCTLQSVNRTVDGELLPNIEEVKITKQ